MPKLSDTQLIILSAASQRDDGLALPLPRSIKANEKARTAACKGLLRAGLIAEQPAPRDGASWRQLKSGERFTLALTDAGRAVLGEEADADGATVPARQDKLRKADAKAPIRKGKPGIAGTKTTKKHESKKVRGANGRSGTKQDTMIALLRGSGGTTIEEAMKATGWQAHSVRGFISGTVKKKLGLSVESEKTEGRGRTYRILA